MNRRDCTNLKARLATDAKLREKFQQDPVSAVEEMEENARDPLSSDRWIYRIVVIALGLTIILCVTGAVWITLAYPKAQVPQIMVALGSGAVGALSGLLAPNPKENSSDQSPKS